MTDNSAPTFRRDLYEPLLGQPIRAIAWLPLNCDTPGVVADRDAPHLTFSGGAVIVAETGAQVFLTWAQFGDRFALATSTNESGWLPDALDRVQPGFNGPWITVRGATLNHVRFYAEADDPIARIVGIRHDVRGQNGDDFVWIGCGGDGLISESDDLWASIGVEPTNLAGLVAI